MNPFVHPPAVAAVTWSLTLAIGTGLALVLAGRARGRPVPPWAVVAAVSLVFFVGLTMLPLPDPARLVCPVPKTDPNYVPLRATRLIWADFQSLPGGLASRLIESGLLSVTLNVIFCVPIGLGLRGSGWGGRATVLSGFALSLGVELTQLTGDWWLYPCAFRKFDVDDLLTNTLGVALGVGLAGVLSRRRGQAQAAA